MRCRNHPEREAAFICQKHSIGYCNECCLCPQPETYCKFRANCPIWVKCMKFSEKPLSSPYPYQAVSFNGKYVKKTKLNRIKKKGDWKMGIGVSDATFKMEVLDSETPVLVDFWAPWCMPCNMVAPVVEEIAKGCQGKLKVCKVNVDEAPKTASSYGIMSIPTLAIFKKGKVVGQILGAVPKAELEALIKPHI